MKPNEWINASIGKHDKIISDYLKKFHETNKDLDELAFAEKLKSDLMLQVLITNSNYRHTKRISNWIEFWSTVFIICFIIALFVVVKNLAN